MGRTGKFALRRPSRTTVAVLVYRKYRHPTRGVEARALGSKLATRGISLSRLIGSRHGEGNPVTCL